MSGSIWDRNTPDEKPSYTKEMLLSQTNLNIVLSTLAGGALLAIPLGLVGIALPVIALGAGEAIASMFIPSSATFRQNVDRKHRRRRREMLSSHLTQEISKRSERDDPNWGVYARLMERAKSLRDMWKVRQNETLTERDVERMEDASLDFLALWLANLSIYDRLKSLNETDLQQRLADVQRRLERQKQNRSLLKAKDDIEELLQRRSQLIARRAAIDAALLALPDAVEEIYQAAFTSPSAANVGERLQEAVDRLHLEEELEESFKDELNTVLPVLGQKPAVAQSGSAGSGGSRS